MSAIATSGRNKLQACLALAVRVLPGAAMVLLSFAVSADEVLPPGVEGGQADQSMYLGWRVFHSTCYGCHGVDATGTSVAPNLVEQIRSLSSRAFTTKVLSRYRITVSETAAAGDDKTELRQQFIDEVLRRERGEVLMPAWDRDPNVKPHVLDIYAYLRARADGTLSPGRPKRQSRGKPEN